MRLGRARGHAERLADLRVGAAVGDEARDLQLAVRLALLPDDGPTGGFFDAEGPLPW